MLSPGRMAAVPADSTWQKSGVQLSYTRIRSTYDRPSLAANLQLAVYMDQRLLQRIDIRSGSVVSHCGVYISERCWPWAHGQSFTLFCLLFSFLFFLSRLDLFIISIMPGVDLILGPMLIGVLLNMMLYGVMCIQMYTYYQHYSKDSAWIRYFMLYLLLVATADVVIEFGIIYDSLIIQNGKQAALVISPKLLPGDSVLISVSSAPIQLFTAWRISVITGSLILPGLIALLSLGSFAAGITVSAKVALNPEYSSFEIFTSEVIVWLVLSAACDIIIAIGMSYALYSRKTGFSVVDGQINRIIQLTVETGSLTALTALADVMLFLVFPRTTINFAVDFPLSALYSCSILAMLNSRDRQRTPDPEYAHTAPQMRTHDRRTSLKPRSSFNRKVSPSLIYTRLCREH
ncbi:hypothetical protein MVEN_00847100 [Mycena venus]|uniref:DUF6534 domain-containing protein n=1 Tax=Mycena venus TaxID=2733690 RepID=A0A8H7D3V3_9AGAR|nr:hypothetical protein MVEN_00847100 [Mycena venus]